MSCRTRSVVPDLRDCAVAFQHNGRTCSICRYTQAFVIAEFPLRRTTLCEEVVVGRITKCGGHIYPLACHAVSIFPMTETILDHWEDPCRMTGKCVPHPATNVTHYTILKCDCRILGAHRRGVKAIHVHESDLLRASGPLKHLGVQLGAYVGKGYDCITEFSFLNYPMYSIPIEIKRYSSGFKYQQRKYGRDELSRAIVLCAFHDHRQMPPHIDVIELDALCQQLKQFPRPMS